MGFTSLVLSMGDDETKRHQLVREAEQLMAATPNQAELSRNPLIMRMQGRFLRAGIEPPSKLKLDSCSPPFFLFTWIRLAVFTATLLIGSTWVLLLTPLRWCHPLFRRLGLQNDSLPMDLAQRLLVRSLCTAACVVVHREGAETVRGPTLLMYSHVSNLDPLAVCATSPTCPKWIAKKDLFMIPLYGWMMLAMGAGPISRSNRSKAVKSLSALQKKFHVWGRSLSIAPEGTRSKTGLLQSFKSVPFYLWEECGGHQGKIGITPICMFGAYELWPPTSAFPLPGQIVVRYLPELKVPSAATSVKGDEKESADDLHSKREAMKSKVFAAMAREVTGVETDSTVKGDGHDGTAVGHSFPSRAGQPLSSLRLTSLAAFIAEYVLLLLALAKLGSCLWQLFALLFAGWSGTSVCFTCFTFVVVVDAAIWVSF